MQVMTNLTLNDLNMIVCTQLQTDFSNSLNNDLKLKWNSHRN